jgi:AcrR family transcriptional regulator
MEAATITEIAEVADLGVGTFYNHFNSKDEIARAVFSAHLEELAATFDRISKSEPDVAQAIAFIQRVFMEKAMRDPLWGWFAIHAEFALQHMDETFGPRAALDFRRGLEGRRFSFTAIDCAVTLTLAALFATLRRILDGRASPAAATDMVEFNLRMYGVPIPEARRLANQPLPAWIFTES